MTPIVNREDLRASLKGAPAATQAAIRDLFQERGWPPLSDEEAYADHARLLEVAVAVQQAAAGLGYTFHLSLDTSPLLELVTSLPPDLADHASMEAVPLGLPNLRHPNKWTVAHWNTVVPILERAKELADRRHRRLMAALRGAGVDDERRHELVGTVTGGRTTSALQLTGPEVRHLAEWAEAAATGMVTELVAYAPDWKGIAKEQGATQADLLATAKEWAKVHKLPPPKKLAEVTDPRAVAFLTMRADDGASSISEVEEAAAEVEAEPTPPPAAEVVVPVIPPESVAHAPETPSPAGAGAMAAAYAEAAEAFRRAAEAFRRLALMVDA